MIIEEYIIKDNDTAQSIARFFYNNPSRWRDIIFFNNLDYPFITKNLDFEKNVPASGQVRFYLKEIKSNNVVIPKGTVVRVDGTEKRYVTQSSKTIVVGSYHVDANVICEFPGYWGNTGMGSIDIINPPISNGIDEVTFDNNTNIVLCPGHGLSDDDVIMFISEGNLPTEINKNKIYYIINSTTDNFQISLEEDGDIEEFTDDGTGTHHYVYGDVFVKNNSSFTNGAVYNVKTTGELLLIPLEIDSEFEIVIMENYLETMGKEDLYFRLDFDIDNYGDLASLTGLQNIAQRISHRLEVEKGELIYHPDYGTNLYQILGRNEPFIRKRAEIEVRNVILQDEAVSEVILKSFKVNSGIIEIECALKLINQDKLESFRFYVERG